MADAWATLGVARDAGEDAIVAAYQRKSRLLSPDIHGGDPDAAAKLAEVKAAFYTLVDISDDTDSAHLQRPRAPQSSQNGGLFGSPIPIEEDDGPLAAGANTDSVAPPSPQRSPLPVQYPDGQDVPAGWYQTLSGPLYWTGTDWDHERKGALRKGATLPGWHVESGRVVWWNKKYQREAPLPPPDPSEDYPQPLPALDSWEPPPSRTPGEAFKVCMTEKYAAFSGRASRSEFWLFFLANNLLHLAGYLVIFMFMPVAEVANMWTGLWMLATAVPMLAVGVRRAHDVNLNGVAIVIPLVNIITAILPGTAGPNNYDGGTGYHDSRMVDLAVPTRHMRTRSTAFR